MDDKGDYGHDGGILIYDGRYWGNTQLQSDKIRIPLIDGPVVFHRVLIISQGHARYVYFGESEKGDNHGR